MSPENPRLVRGDMRDLSTLDDETFDAALIMWQSWGYFTPRENDDVLRALASRLRPGGRLVLDVYHRDFFERHQGVREREHAGRQIVERKTMDGTRLRVELAYDGVPRDVVEWELVTPEELTERGATLRFEAVLTCAGFDESVEARGEEPRFQAVLERV